MKKKSSSALIAMVVLILVISVSSFSLVKVMKPAEKIKTSILKSEVTIVTDNGYTLYDPFNEVVTLQLHSVPDSSCTLVDIFITYNDGSQTVTRQFAPDANMNKRYSFSVAPYLAEKYPISVYAVPYCFIDGEWVYGERTPEIFISSQTKEDEFYEGIDIESAQQDVTKKIIHPSEPYDPPQKPIHVFINAGGESYTDLLGNRWLADYGFLDGNALERTISIARTDDDYIFATERWGVSAYEISVPNNKQYDVILYFAETYEEIDNSGERVFDVSVEGVSLSNVDIFDEVGLNTATRKHFSRVFVSDGVLNINFIPRTQETMIKGIEISSSPIPECGDNILDTASECGIGYICSEQGVCVLEPQQECIGQTLAERAACFNLKIGAAMWGYNNQNYVDLVTREFNVMTATSYRHTFEKTEGDYNWGYIDPKISFAEAHAMDVHMHPLIYASDQHTAPWILNKPLNEIQGYMVDHITRVASNYKGRVDVYDVVNEAIVPYGNGYRGDISGNNIYYKAMGEDFLNLAFETAHAADPDAILIYNDFDMETNDALQTKKFNFVKNTLIRLQSEGVPIHGLGWQMHVTADEVLDANFPLAARMQEISDLGLINYITELDVTISDTSQANLDKQKRAYKKITQIFLDVEKRGYLQTWGVHDGESWLAQSTPLLYDANLQEKPAYDGVKEALQEGNEVAMPEGDEGVVNPVPTGVVWIKNVASGLYLHQTSDTENAPVDFLSFDQNAYSRRWEVIPLGDNVYRLKCLWGDNYLFNSGAESFSAVQVQDLNPAHSSQKWEIIAHSDNTFTIKNIWGGNYLHAGEDNYAKTVTFDSSSQRQKWILEPIT